MLMRHHLCYENHYAACDFAVSFLFLYVVYLATLIVLLLMPYEYAVLLMGCMGTYYS